MATKIVTKNSSTASAVPTASDLVQGELAVNVADKRLFTEDNAGAIVELGTNPSGNVTFQDNGKAIFGAGSDLQIYHNATSNIIDSSAATLAIQAPQFVVQDATGAKNMVWVPQNGGAYEVQLSHDGSTKLTTTSTGIDVTGTATMDGLEIATTASDTGVELTLNGNKSSNGGVGSIIFENAGDSVGMIRSNRASANDAADMLFYTQATGGANTERMRIDSSGNVGIGTGSPSRKVHIDGGSTDAAIQFTNTNTGSTGSDGTYIGHAGTGTDFQLFNNETGYMRFGTAGTERMRIDSSGNVGIGVSAPTRSLVLGKGDSTGVQTQYTNSTTGAAIGDGFTVGIDGSENAEFWNFENTNMLFATNGTERMRIDSSGDLIKVGGVIKGERGTAAAPPYTFSDDTDTGMFNISNADLGFSVGGTERMRIDASGNLLVGTSTTAAGNEGMVYFNGSSLRVTRDSDEPLNLDRLTSDGHIAVFKKDGTTIGDVGVNNNNNLRIQGNSSHCGLEFGTNAIYPHKNSANVDNQIDLGESGLRYKDLYLSGGVYLGGTGSANKLDDYETGSWTLTDQSGAGMSLTVYVAEYTKIGNKVFFEIGMEFPTTSSTAEIRLSLPFTAKSTPDNTGGATLVGTNSGRNDLWLVNRNNAFFGAGTNLNTSVTNASYSGKQLKLQGAYTAA